MTHDGTGWCKGLASGQCEERADRAACMHTETPHAHRQGPLIVVSRAVPDRL